MEKQSKSLAFSLFLILVTIELSFVPSNVLNSFVLVVWISVPALEEAVGALLVLQSLFHYFQQLVVIGRFVFKEFI